MGCGQSGRRFDSDILGFRRCCNKGPNTGSASGRSAGRSPAGGNFSVPKPNLRMLVRSLRTKQYEKLEIQKLAAPVGAGTKSPHSAVPSQTELDFGNEPHGEVHPDKTDL